MNLEENSVVLTGGKLCFEYDTQVDGEKEADIKRNSSPVVAGEAAQKDAFGVGKVSTRSSVSQEAGFDLSLPSKDLVITPWVQDDDFPTDASSFHSNQQIQGDNALAQRGTGYHQKEVSNSSMKLGDFSGVDPQFDQSVDIAEYFAQNFKIIPKLKHKQPVYKRAGSKLDSFYGAFVDVAEYLDLKQLFSACVFDPFWNRVIEILKTQKGYIFEDKTFFIYKSVLMCKLKYKNYEIVKS